MAVIDSIPGIEVFVEIEGQKATEYDDPAGARSAEANGDVEVLATANIESPSVELELKHRPHVVKYIEIKPDSAFSIRTIRGPKFQRIGNFICWGAIVDGNHTRWKYDQGVSEEKDWDTSISHFHSYSEDLGHQKHALRFAALHIDSENGTTKPDMLRGKSCGTIRVQLFHMMGFGENIKQPVISIPSGPASLPEKALKGKALSAVAQYDHGSPSLGPRNCKKFFHDPKKRPFATIEFHYRTREDLMQEGIVPRPTLEERIRDMSEAELRVGFLRELQDKERRLTAPKVEKEDTAFVSQSRVRGSKRGASELSDETAIAGNPYKQRHLENGRIEIELLD